MRNFIDYFSLRLIVFLASFIGISFIADKFYIAILSALGITFCLSIIIDILSRKHRTKNMLYSQFLQQSIIGGNDYVLDLVLDTLAITKYRHEANYITCEYRDKPIIIINAIKFGAVTPDEVLRYYQLCRSKHVEECYLLSRIMDRRCLALSRHLDNFDMHLITTKYLYRLALKRSSKSDKHMLEKKVKDIKVDKLHIMDIANVMFSRRNCSRYLLTSFILAFMSIFTPLTSYYLVMSSITVVLAALCLMPISDYSSPTKLGIFSRKTAEEEEAYNKSLNSLFTNTSAYGVISPTAIPIDSTIANDDDKPVNNNLDTNIDNTSEVANNNLSPITSTATEQTMTAPQPDVMSSAQATLENDDYSI